MKTIIFATTNKDKLVEIREILGESAGEIKTMTEIGFTGEIEEDGTTFRENAAIKANAVADFIKEKRLLSFELPEYIKHRNLYLAYRSDFIMKSHVQDFVNFIQKHYQT